MNKVLLVAVWLFSSSSFASRNVVLIGAPGSGKGTLARALVDMYGLPHISSGDIVRDHIKRGTKFGNKVAEMTAKGLLLPDNAEFMGHLVSLIQQRLESPDCSEGFILDGFPRTHYQAMELDRVMKRLGRRIDAAVLIEISRPTVLKRLTERTNCPTCKVSYNKSTRAPKHEMVCDICDKLLTVRDDDRPEVVNRRFDIFASEIKSVVEYYDKQLQLVRINGELGTDAEIGKISTVLNQPYPRAYLQERIPKFPRADNPNIKMYNLVDMYKDPGLVQHLVKQMQKIVDEFHPDFIAAPEARALPLFGALIHVTGIPGIFLRKAGKIPEGAPRIRESYATAYSSEIIEMTLDDALKGKSVVLIDDGLSSGGTTAATVRLLEKAGMNVLQVVSAIRYHYAPLCDAYLEQKLESRTQTLLDLN